MIQRGVELVDRVGSKCVSDVSAVESDPHHTGLTSPVIGDVGEVEAFHFLPKLGVEDLRNHDQPGYDLLCALTADSPRLRRTERGMGRSC